MNRVPDLGNPAEAGMNLKPNAADGRGTEKDWQRPGGAHGHELKREGTGGRQEPAPGRTSYDRKAGQARISAAAAAVRSAGNAFRNDRYPFETTAPETNATRTRRSTSTGSASKVSCGPVAPAERDRGGPNTADSPSSSGASTTVRTGAPRASRRATAGGRCRGSSGCASGAPSQHPRPGARGAAGIREPVRPPSRPIRAG